VLQAAHRLFSAQVGEKAAVGVAVIPERLGLLPVQNGERTVLAWVYMPM